MHRAFGLCDLSRGARHYSINEDAGGNDGFGAEAAKLADLCDGGDGVACCHRHNRAEVSCSIAINEVAPAIANLGVDQCIVDSQRPLEDVRAPVNDASFLALG